MKHLQTFESFSNEELNEGLFSYDQKSLQKDMDSGKPVDEILNRAFAGSLKLGAVRKVASSATDENKQEVLQAALQDPDGIGALRISGNELVYLEKAKVKYKGKGGAITGTGLA
jgi:hypothetical protein